MKKRKEKMLKTLFFIGIMMSIILTGTLCMAASGEIDVDRITIGEDNIEDIKQTFIYYVIGAVLLFATVNIVSIVYDIFW